ncbi:MAG: YkgJ family cysteine cluster protein [Bacillota bacterium]
MLPVADVYSVLIYAKNNGYFTELNDIYAQIPKHECGDCTECCKDAPAAFFLEYLNVYGHLRERLPQEQSVIVRRAIEFFFLELVDPGRKCPFHDEESGCLIRQVRPLGCRIFGLLNKDDYEDVERKRILRLQEIAADFRTVYGMELPAALLVARPFCNKNGGPDRIDLDSVEEYRMRLTTLDSRIVSPELVFRERTYLPLPVQLAMTVLNPGVRGKRVEVMREYINGSRELLDKYTRRGHGFKF